MVGVVHIVIAVVEDLPAYLVELIEIGSVPLLKQGSLLVVGRDYLPVCCVGAAVGVLRRLTECVWLGVRDRLAVGVRDCSWRVQDALR